MNPQPRPRCYSFDPSANFASEHIGWLVAGLAETTERHFDMVRQLGPEMLDARLGQAPSSVLQVTAHLGWADAYWFGAWRGEAIPVPDALDRDRHEPPSPISLDEVIAACRDARDLGLEALREATDPHQARPWRGEGKLTAHGVLMHLIWHWTYHSGQCGEIALSQGYSHPWTFEQHVGRIVPGSR